MRDVVDWEADNKCKSPYRSVKNRMPVARLPRFVTDIDAIADLSVAQVKLQAVQAQGSAVEKAVLAGSTDGAEVNKQDVQEATRFIFRGLEIEAEQ